MSFLPVQPWNISLDGGQMEGIRFGRGRKSLMLIPGLTLRSARQAALPLAWAYRIFAKEYTVYVPDKRTNLSPGTTIQQLACHLAQAMEKSGLKQADLLGFSQGGMIAQALALARPDLVHKAVLAVTACRPNPVMEQVITDWIAMARQNNCRALALSSLQKMYSPAYLKKYKSLLPLLTRLGKLPDPRRFVILAQACLAWNAYQQLPQIRCPVLVIGGRQDQVVTAAASEEMAQRLRCRLFLYENLGHAAYDEAPDFNRRVLEFLHEPDSAQ